MKSNTKKLITNTYPVLSYLCLIIGLLLLCIDSNLAGADYKPLYGACYSPFREGQSPETGVFPTLAQIEEDVSILENTTRSIRTYGNDNVLYNIPQICQSHGVECYVGSWVSDDAVWNQTVISNLTIVANLNYATTKALLVGNEYLLWRPFGSESTLINLINQLKAAVDLPVSTAETYNVWLQHPNLAAAVEFIGTHIHPYWEGVSIENAAQHTIDKYNLLKQQYPGKDVVILEVGWPSGGPAYGAAVPSPENQKRFLKEFIYLAKKNDIKYFLFEAYDEPWKAKFGQVEAHWGLWDKARVLKPGLADYLYADPADINKDLWVNRDDLLELAKDWLEQSNGDGPYRPGDINQNGAINLTDFALLTETWLKTLP